MIITQYTFKRIDKSEMSNIKELFTSVFCKEPWNDDWSDEDQLDAYLAEEITQSISLTFGLYDGPKLVGVSMGRIKHWYQGTEYVIDELCISRDYQGQGLGKLFISELEKACKELDIVGFFLLTDRDVPAYVFYKKLGFSELKTNVAFFKEIE